MKSHICELPLEVSVNVLNYLSYEDASKLTGVCKHFERSVCYLFRRALYKLNDRINNELNNCLIKLKSLPMNEEHLRIDFVKLLTFLRFLLTEMEVMFALIWRYSSFDSVWSIICPLLAPVIDEFNRNIEQQVNLNARHLDINVYNLRMIFHKWHEFLFYYDTELPEKLNVLMPNPVSFEIMVIDLLTSCPSINFQLAFKRLIESGNNKFNIYSFFKLNHLKPSCQIPNIHNSELNNNEKLSQLIKFLRECIQWENMAHLQELLHKILESEMRLWLVQSNGDELINEINEGYMNVQMSPYEPIERKAACTKSNEGTHWNEHYCRSSSYNESITGLRCIVDLPNQSINNQPLILSILRGCFRSSLHDIVFTKEMINFDNIGSHYNLISYDGRNIYKKPKFQLIIQYRERLLSAPAEAVINIAYDENKESHITMDFIESEPLVFFGE